MQIIGPWKSFAEKGLSIRDNTLYLDKNENAYAGNECQRTKLFIFWRFWMLLQMQKLFLNVL